MNISKTITILSSILILQACAIKPKESSAPIPEEILPDIKIDDYDSDNQSHDEKDLDLHNSIDKPNTTESHEDNKNVIKEKPWSTSKVKFTANEEQELFSFNPINKDHVKKFSSYTNLDQKEAVLLTKNKIEQDLIGNTWLKNEDIFAEYQIYSDPIFQNINNHFNLDKNKNLNDKLKKHHSLKKNALEKNYSLGTNEQKINLYPLFRFPIEFETSILKDGFYYSMAPLYLKTSGSLLDLKTYMSDSYKIYDRQNKPIDIQTLDNFLIPNISINLKSCLNKSDLPYDNILDKLSFAQKLLSSYNFLKIDSLMKNNGYKSRGNDSYQKAKTKTFVAYYHNEISFNNLKKPLSCEEVFKQYQKITDSIELKKS